MLTEKPISLRISPVLALLPLAVAVPAPVFAQSAGHPAATTVVTPAQAQQALAILQDPQKREQLIAVLHTIAAAAPTAPAAPASNGGAAKPAPAVALKPNSLVAQLLVAMSAWSVQLGTEAAAILGTLNNLPALWRWLARLRTNPEAGMSVLVAAGWLALVFGCALLVEFVSSRVLRRPRALLTRRLPREAHGSAQLLRLLPFALIGLLLDLVPVAAFAAVGNLLVGVIAAAGEETRLVVIAVVNAYAANRAVMCVIRMLLSPGDRRLRLWRLGDSDARFVVMWARRIVAVAIFGNAFIEVALLLGLDPSAHDGFERLLALALAAMLIIVVIRSRRGVAGYIRACGASRWWTWFAEAWPYLAVTLIVSFWIGLATGKQGGFSGLYLPGVTLAAIIAARLLMIIVLGTLERVLRVTPQTHDRLPALSRRVAFYRRPLEIVASAVIAALCVVVVLQLWGAPAFAWFLAGGIGSRLLSALITIAIAVAAAIVVWETAHAILERYLARLGESDHSRSARVRTLLPLLRTTLLTAILTVIGLTALSEIGVNIAPLLAGAGIAGIALGFGAQRLVQDVITGIFVVFENAIQIGDGVVAAGLSGAVEQLSVRTLRLRAADGALHIIPFSAVTSITNSSRGLGNATVSVTVAYQEDTDRVAEVLREIAAALRRDREFGAMILGDLQLFGVDEVKPSGVTMTGQIACTDSGRWPVQREFNRRLKIRFSELNITLAG